jgi:hypothetical protein
LCRQNAGEFGTAPVTVLLYSVVDCKKWRSLNASIVTVCPALQSLSCYTFVSFSLSCEDGLMAQRSASDKPNVRLHAKKPSSRLGPIDTAVPPRVVWAKAVGNSVPGGAPRAGG